MSKLGKNLWDDPAYVRQTLVPASSTGINLGTLDAPFDYLYVNNLIAPNIFGGDLSSPNGLDSLLVQDTGSFLSLSTGNSFLIQVNGSSKFTVSSTGLVMNGGTVVQSPTFNLSDGSTLNHNVSTSASGTAYTLTATPAALTFGTSSPTLVLDKAGTYVLLARANLEYAGATFAANRTVTLKLRRTNNTAADLTGGSTALGTNIVTTVSGVLSAALLPPVFYTTSNTNDIVTIFGDVSVVPSAGALNATEANIIAFRIA